MIIITKRQNNINVSKHGKHIGIELCRQKFFLQHFPNLDTRTSCAKLNPPQSKSIPFFSVFILLFVISSTCLILQFASLCSCTLPCFRHRRGRNSPPMHRRRRLRESALPSNASHVRIGGHAGLSAVALTKAERVTLPLRRKSVSPRRFEFAPISPW